ncbi:hypothetical protein [Dysgonomonas sp. BGC7]|uniref:hypothetical protein n=1 Tax=Dysgonomonas sp. BGC7 TaxID=1658008 RepID=UPI0006836BE3|nr:hypothetical protein [Dysgonomonas sp. BGC7]MBD8388853.1 hypothetical protein [Dysgonomonas sp. BGC7]
MKYLYLLLFTSLLYHSCKYQNEVPSNFNFIINDGANDSYNSEKGLFYRESLIESKFYDDDSILTKGYIIDKKEYSIKLKENDYKRVYKLYKSINFQSFPSKFEIEWDNPEIIITSPSFESSLEIYENNNCKKVIADIPNINNPIKDRKQSIKYLELYDLIWEIIKEKEEYKITPKSNMVYF